LVFIWSYATWPSIAIAQTGSPDWRG
jgi:hypothetical protein